jgi:hypothetical protein
LNPMVESRPERGMSAALRLDDDGIRSTVGDAARLDRKDAPR